jgi:hypothetical protein
MKDFYMNKKTVLISLTVGVSFIGIILLSGGKKEVDTTSTSSIPTDNNVVRSSSVAQTITPADKIEVVNFFGTQRCVSCLTIGKLSKQTIDEKFSDEVKSGKIVFKEINGELPENRDVVMKYQARGSSLFINAIRGEKEDIKEDVTVWRLVSNEEQFISYLEGKLNGLLGK